MELVAGVGHSLAAVPADALELLGGERLGDQLVVVHRYHVLAGAANERGEHIGRQRHPRRGDRAVGRVHPHPAGDVLEPLHLGLLEDPHAERQAGPLESPDQAGGVNQRGPVVVEDAAFVEGGVHPRPDLFSAQDLHVVTHRVSQLRLLVHVAQLPRRHGHPQLPGALEVAFDAVARNGRLDLVEVLAAQTLDDVHLLGEPVHPVGESVGQRVGAEPAVTARGARSSLELLNDDDDALGVTLLGEQRGPQAGVAGPHHAEVGTDIADQRGMRGGLERVRVEPPEVGLDVGEVTQDEGILLLHTVSNQRLESPSLQRPLSRASRHEHRVSSRSWQGNCTLRAASATPLDRDGYARSVRARSS